MEQEPFNTDELRRRVAESHAQQWDEIGMAERTRRAKSRGLYPDPSVQPTPEELRIAIKLPGDDMKYVRLATDRNGFPPRLRPHGRRKTHFTKRQMIVKSEALRVFRGLFVSHANRLQAAAQANNEVFNGVPETDMPKLGARAAILAEQHVRRNLALSRKRHRNQQILSRKINNGLLPRNVNRKRFIG